MNQNPPPGGTPPPIPRPPHHPSSTSIPPQFVPAHTGTAPRQSISLKILFIVLLSLLLLIPDMIIYSLNDERADRQKRRHRKSQNHGVALSYCQAR